MVWNNLFCVFSIVNNTCMWICICVCEPVIILISINIGTTKQSNKINTRNAALSSSMHTITKTFYNLSIAKQNKRSLLIIGYPQCAQYCETQHHSARLNLRKYKQILYSITELHSSILLLLGTVTVALFTITWCQTCWNPSPNKIG